ncbi:MAG: YdeI/OmpD-associated family protein [Ferruginibacter sp.]
MGKKEKFIDAYISKSAAFAQPVLNHIRDLVHSTCPEVEEKMKWSFPHFDYKGEMMCSMAAFKHHAVLGFWKAALMKDSSLLQKARSEESMGHFGKITSVNELPPDKKLIAYIKEAMKLNNLGIKLPSKPKSSEKKDIIVPDYFATALSKNKKAAEIFDAFSPSHKKEYVEWITGAKTEETKVKRMARAIETMTEGKSLNWKYAKK